MSGHADTILYLRQMLVADERHSFTAALDALLAENQRLREAVTASDEALAWITERHPAVLREMPTREYQALRAASKALAGDTE